MLNIVNKKCHIGRKGNEMFTHNDIYVYLQVRSSLITILSPWTSESTVLSRCWRETHMISLIESEGNFVFESLGTEWLLKRIVDMASAI